VKNGGNNVAWRRNGVPASVCMSESGIRWRRSVNINDVSSKIKRSSGSSWRNRGVKAWRKRIMAAA